MCRPCRKVQNRMYYLRNTEKRLVWESSRVHEGISVELYRRVVSEHNGKCFITHAIGKPLVLVPVSLSGPLEGEALSWRNFVPVVRQHGHHSALPEPHRSRYQAWLRVRNGAAIATTPEPPPAIPRPALVTKGMQVGPPKRRELARYLIDKAKEYGIDPIKLYEGIVFASANRPQA